MERQPLFVDLQARLAQTVLGGRGERAVIAVPSLDFGPRYAARNDVAALEARAAHLVLLLRDPGVRLALVSSLSIAAAEIDQLLALVGAPGARERLLLVAVGDPSPRPLAEKLLRRPDLVERLRAFAAPYAPDRAAIAPFAVGRADRELAVALGVPIDGIDPRFAHHGTKGGGRRLLAAAGVPIPLGEEGLTGPGDLVAALRRLRRRLPELARAVVKLDSGVKGDGNRVLELGALPPPGAVDELGALDRLVAGLGDDYLERVAAGAVVEELVTGLGFASPSAQARIEPDGRVELLCTHDQILGGPRGQSYEAARLPAASSYAWQVAALTERVGRRLAAEGAVGRFGVDYVVVRAPFDDGWRVRGVELNLREGATSHPYATARLLTGARLDARGALVAPDGAAVHAFATDALASPAWRGLAPETVTAALRRAGIAFDPDTRRGVVLQMLGALEAGRIGFTAIGGSLGDCIALRHRVRSLLDGLAVAPAVAG